MSEFADLLPASQAQMADHQAEVLMAYLIDGLATELETLQILNQLCDRNLSVDEVVSFARVMRARAVILNHPFDDLIDTCGTGGGLPTLNISTASALIAAGAGARVAKHGNRSSTGQGSADVLEFLGVSLGVTPDRLV